MPHLQQLPGNTSIIPSSSCHNSQLSLMHREQQLQQQASRWSGNSWTSLALSVTLTNKGSAEGYTSIPTRPQFEHMVRLACSRPEDKSCNTIAHSVGDSRSTFQLKVELTPLLYPAFLHNGNIAHDDSTLNPKLKRVFLWVISLSVWLLFRSSSQFLLMSQTGRKYLRKNLSLFCFSHLTANKKAFVDVFHWLSSY